LAVAGSRLSDAFWRFHPVGDQAQIGSFGFFGRRAEIGELLKKFP
jgi:hypothetical protein